MVFNSGTFFSVILFILVIVFVLSAIVLGSIRSDNKKTSGVVGFLLVWNVMTTVLVITGLVRDYFLPIGVMLFGSIVISAIAFSTSSLGKSFENLPSRHLVLFQSFRLPLEIVLYLWSLSKTVPETMAWTGHNFDVLTGFLALGVLIPKLRSQKYFWFFNCAGIALLLNVVFVVIMSSPLPFAWPVENPLQLLAHFPYHLIATVCVWGAIVGHVILTKKLLSRKE